jgi:antitoxin (DNA-binding transcriptional repressor) of toxin-antitoxin stability system
MHVTISKLRQDLFRLVDRAWEGEPVQFTHKGIVFQIVPETTPDKLARLTRQTVVAPGGQLGQAGKDLLAEMEAEWQEDWAEL